MPNAMLSMYLPNSIHRHQPHSAPSIHWVKLLLVTIPDPFITPSHPRHQIVDLTHPLPLVDGAITRASYEFDGPNGEALSTPIFLLRTHGRRGIPRGLQHVHACSEW
ncbi:hypothetical protein FIBSPDRAFT_854839 [Athelia psychrophila]|uniref:Uncharacterized protein n=1 Tax=Athelia psychrophila TaxID=1759441 RepID=A0A166PWN0_9AGAM|nr:hypothetical protein FIBSPDRAFT_878700 [Fibularhizoctonia sp. CBS 109695]KZP26525.1 hypothetical protein FIBSPDRAFT_854839 [Fibularhizoctonia sp. CBS 109695]